MTAQFDPGRNRDAWAVFRGYVYQVNVTLDRWLELEAGELLELERGEDVDLLGRAAAAEGEERARLLEQVKHLERTITLRSAPAREFLANACAHLRNNPQLSLRFRFTTTADPVLERPTTMPGDVAGIVAWEQIRTAQWPQDNLASALAATRDLLTSPNAPTSVPQPTWDDFQAFVRDAAPPDFAAFIDACEWSPKHSAAGDYEEQLKAKLVALRIAPELGAAMSLYDRLMAFVFHVLTQRGAKRLTQEALFEQVALWRAGVPLSPEDDRRVRELREIVRVLETRMVVMESAVSELQSLTAGSAAMIDTLARQQGISAAVQYVARVVALDEPPQVERASSRQATVSEVLRRRGDASWVALHGVSGIGKSQLALLVARAASDARVWIRFRDLAVPEACLRLDAALGQLAGAVPPDPPRSVELLLPDPRDALGRLGRSAVLVLDDLPRYRGGDELSDRLTRLVRAAAELGVLIVSTSPLPVPAALLDVLGHGDVCSIAAPPFTIDDVRDILAAHGAPERWRGEGLAQLVHAATAGHPTLVRACASDLVSRGWAADMRALGRVLGADFTAGVVNDETVRALIASTPDPASRELLYRLNLVGSEFTPDDLLTLAAVDPIIPQPREHLDPLLGLWVQSEGGGRYTVSPLVRPLGGSELRPPTLRSCHAQLAERIVSGHVMSELDATRAITHFINAEAYDSAGWVLIRGLISLRGLDLPAGVRPLFANIWLDMPLPERMAGELRLMVRALQIGFSARTGHDTDYLLADLERLLANIGDSDRWAAFTACMFAADSLAPTDVSAAGSYLIRTLRLRPQVLTDLEARGVTAPELPLEQLIWMMLPAVNNADTLAAWLEVLEQMTPEERTHAFEVHDIGRPGASQVANKLMFYEEDKPPGSRDWNIVLDSLNGLTTRAHAMGLFVLADAAVVARMTILGEFRSDLLAAEALATEVLSRTGVDPDTQFYVTNSMALLHYDYGSRQHAREWLTRAFALRTPAYGRQSVRGAVLLSMRVADDDPRYAREILADASKFAEEHADDVGLALVEAFAERSVADWLAGDLPAAFRSWDRAASALLEANDATADWKSIFVLFGHVSGYLASMATTGQPPGRLADGEPYAAPARGLFIRSPENRAQAYTEEKARVLPMQLSFFAEALGYRDRAAAWATMAADEARATGRIGDLIVLLPTLIVKALDEREYDRAVAIAWEYGAITEAVLKGRSRNPDFRLTDPTRILGPEGGDLWLGAESTALQMIVPAYFSLASAAASKSEDTSSYLPACQEGFRHCAARSADPAVWHAAIELFDAIFNGNAAGPDLVARVTGYNFRVSDSAGPLHVVAYLAASRGLSTALEDALGIQLAVAPFIDRFILPHSRSFGEAAGEFFGTYWYDRFDSARFRFSNPRELERRLAAAREAGPERMRLVLAAIVAGVGYELRADQKAWLFGSGT
jgi:hypothetical protein